MINPRTCFALGLGLGLPLGFVKAINQNIPSTHIDNPTPFKMGGFVSYGGVAFFGRKFGLATSYKIAGTAANILNQEKAANQWNQTSDNYWKLAKKDAYRDLPLATACFALTFRL